MIILPLIEENFELFYYLGELFLAGVSGHRAFICAQKQQPADV